MGPRSPRHVASSLFVVGLLSVTACAEEPGADADGDDPLLGSISQMASRPGAWSLPAGVDPGTLVTYDDAPPWDGGAHCSGTFTDGARELGEFLSDMFPGISEVQGYSCRQNTANASQTSMHGTGRAIDVMVPTSGGAADNDVGDEIAAYLVEHCAEIGVQYIIWDQMSWNGSRSSSRQRAYTGPNPHIDHLHVELNLEAADRSTPFFTDGPVAPPPPPPVPPPPPPPPPPAPPPPATPPPAPPPGSAARLDARIVEQGSDLVAGSSGASLSGRACSGDAFVFWFDVENTGNTRWTDYGGSTGAPGDRVGLGVLSTGVDPLTGVDHVSILSATNVDVQPGGADCNNAAGCRRTVFTMRATAGLPGTHTSRWRLSDPSFGLFGPELRFDAEVMDCSAGGSWEDDEPAGPSGPTTPPPSTGGDAPGARVMAPGGSAGGGGEGTGELAGGCSAGGGNAGASNAWILGLIAMIWAGARRVRTRHA